ncbi:hypothetical protein WME76_23280 [Sorangium sp. So ce119]|uniref:hypothetical protein n=1 Tax=Sorangium sp. So ce119 TaxID=3133279 RepID=UPI003F63B0AB
MFQLPAGVPAVRLELDHVVLPPSTPAGAIQFQITDAVGGTVIATSSYTPTTAPENVVAPAVALPAGVPYLARIVVRSGAAQASFLCGRFRVRPVGADSSLYNDFMRVNVHPAILHATNEPTHECLQAWRNPRHCEMSEFAHILLKTDASEFDVEYVDTVKRLMGAERANPSVWVDGEPIDPAVSVVANTATFGRITVPGARNGAWRSFAIYSGPQMTSLIASTANLDAIRGENRGVFPVGVYLPGSASVDLVLPANRPVVTIADSKGAGAHSSIPGVNSWRFMMARKGVAFIAHAAGGDGLAHLVGGTPPSRLIAPWR